jgi:hypothetical protein
MTYAPSSSLFTSLYKKESAWEKLCQKAREKIVTGGVHTRWHLIVVLTVLVSPRQCMKAFPFVQIEHAIRKEEVSERERDREKNLLNETSLECEAALETHGVRLQCPCPCPHPLQSNFNQCTFFQSQGHKSKCKPHIHCTRLLRPHSR